jgi:hypothetical protein
MEEDSRLIKPNDDGTIKLSLTTVEKYEKRYEYIPRKYYID